jgi:hypothetical protein
MAKSLELTNFNSMIELDARQDSFGKQIELLWDPADDSVHLAIDRFVDVPLTPMEAIDCMDHPYSLVASHLGETVVDAIIVPVSEAA